MVVWQIAVGLSLSENNWPKQDWSKIQPMEKVRVLICPVLGSPKNLIQQSTFQIGEKCFVNYRSLLIVLTYLSVTH